MAEFPLLASLFTTPRPIIDNDLDINTHPTTHCSTAIELSQLLRNNIATDVKEVAVYTEEYNWRCTYANAFEYMKNKPEGAFYYLFTTKSALSPKMIPTVLSYVFIINVNGKQYFSFCPQFV